MNEKKCLVVCVRAKLLLTHREHNVKTLVFELTSSCCRHTTRFLVLWLTFMPYCIWDQLGWFTVPVSVIIAFLLLGIEEIGIQIEEPFGILALEVGGGWVKICGMGKRW